MKKTILTFGLAFLGLSAVYAQDSGSDIYEPEEGTTTEEATTTESATFEDDRQDKVSISKDQLPSAVQDAIEGGAYANMDFKEAYTVSATQTGQTGGNMASAAYMVLLEDEQGQKTKVTFNEQGQIVSSEEKSHDKKDKKKRDY